MRAKDWLKTAETALADAENPDYKYEAKAMLCDVMRIPLGRLFLKSEEELSREETSLLDRQLTRRLTGVPLQYVQGKAYFMGYEFFVDERCLIPRQDTELLCEIAIRRIGNRPLRVLDACSGSGAVAIAVALNCPNAFVFASDISRDALDVARVNALRLRADVAFAEGDFLGAFDGDFDLITCNPPYLSEDDMLHLQKEVRLEPKTALYGGRDGLDFYRRAFSEAPARLKTGGAALFEVGLGQAEAIKATGRDIKIYKDLNGIDRVIEFGGY